MTLIKTLTEDHIYDGSLESSWMNKEFPMQSLPADKVYLVLSQMGPNGQVGFGFLRMDNGMTPIKGDIHYNTKNIIFVGEIDETSQFGKMAKENFTKESARKSGIVLGV